MKFKCLFIITITSFVMMASCLSEPEFEPVVEGSGIPINLDGAVKHIATKVNAQGFETGDALGLYAVNYENANQTPGTLKDEGNQADHVKYIFDFENWKWTPVKHVHYKDANTNVDLYAFYPYAEPESVTAYNFEVQKDQNKGASEGRLAGYEDSDFLWAKVENVAPTEEKIKMTLDHKMAGVHVILKEGEGFAQAGDWELLDKKVLVANTTRKATINLATGIVTPLGDPQATGIVMALQSDASFRAIVVPQTVTAGTPLFNITIGGVSYNFTKSENFTYAPNKLSTFTIKIDRKYPTGEYELVLDDTQILEWKEDINTHEGEARQYYCVHCDEPGTLGTLIKADKKNPDKIRNLKVSGKISDEDFYFMRDSMAILEAVNLKESKVVDVYEYRDAGAIYINDVIPEKAFENKKSLYYFTFPEKITKIFPTAFANSSLSGTLDIPDDCLVIGNRAFAHTNISTVLLPISLESIESHSFNNCKSLSGTLNIPDNLKSIGDYAFGGCSLSGRLILPNTLTYLGDGAFHEAGMFKGDLRIPDNIQTIKENTFSSQDHHGCFDGILDLNNVTHIDDKAFYSCGFSGELNIPENLTTIGSWAFRKNNFTRINFNPNIKIIGEMAFSECGRLTGNLNFPEGIVSIESKAFSMCGMVESLSIPSSLQVLGQGSFAYCYNLNQIVSNSTEPPIIHSDTFSGVAKDNFIVEVPVNAVSRYKADALWGEFKRISAHHDFSISRPLARSLNAETSKTYILRAPTGQDWSIESKPAWVTVTPSSGTGKAEVTVTFAEMRESDIGTFESELTDEWGNYQGTTTYGGRAGEIVFLLNDKDYRSNMTVEQYDYKYGDGNVITLHESTKGNGVNIIFLADCYDARDIASGDYLNDIQQAYGYYFDVEPYKTYKDYFNVYAVFGESDDSGMGTINTIRNAKFGSQYSLNGISPNFETCYEYAKKADSGINPSQTLIVMVENTTEYGGICYMWGDGSAVACCPKSSDAYPYDFRGIIQHEAGGHGFGKLADEYIYHNAFIQSCGCPCCEHLDDLLRGKARGWYRNLEVTGNLHEVGWAHLIFHPKYSNVVDVYEGGYFHSRGVYRSEPTSCMNNNIPYYSAISRQAIVERIMEYSGEEFTLDKFYALDSDEFGATQTKSFMDNINVEPIYNNGKQYGPVFMGDKPDFLK